MTKTLFSALAALALLALLAFGACVVDSDPHPMCEDLDSYVAECTTCNVPPSCSQALELLLDSATDSVDYQGCLECLAAEAANGDCRDCVLEDSGESCTALLGETLGLDCL